MEVENNNATNPPPASAAPAAPSTADAPAAAPAAAATSPAGNERFTIKKWNGVSLWSWDISVETCAICRNPIMDLCIECQANSQNTQASECSIAWGVCNHAFHNHCISKWLQTRNVCPLDNGVWAYQKVGK